MDKHEMIRRVAAGESVTDVVNEAFWSQNVKPKWKAPEGFFSQSADKIAKGLKSKSKNLQQAMARLNFYINRAGKNLGSSDRSRLEKAKKLLSSLY